MPRRDPWTAAAVTRGPDPDAGTGEPGDGSGSRPGSDPGAAQRLVAFLACRTAEEYFAALGVDYQPRVLAVNRLHILRYFAGEVARIDRELPGLADPGRRLAAYRTALYLSHQAFVGSSALDHRLFKVLRDRAPRPPEFLPLDQVTVDPPPPTSPSSTTTSPSTGSPSPPTGVSG